ncbi:conserved protein of unknown function (plasmid) [Rhodovastum atsumiense]|uniref:Uncharacterized protein n=1 Tax=Rhodovastum atsumiense TaxID=504468 RepID=A0A5M6IVV8_9PROT|nr:hypothetical protein [Rhodovastum atsumiense]KAA5611545.1 hypothetical protein F1189_13340 [Rhodovastum atsumiense]CAH2606229.1 conserved protein of unknown function [Rhodovastum atsumiense]
MDKILSFLRARLAERSSRIQLVVLLMLLLVLAGAVTLDQLTAWTDKIVALVTVLGPLAGILVPDNNRAVDAAAAQDAAVAAALKIATETAEKAAGPGARQASLAISSAVERLGL